MFFKKKSKFRIGLDILTVVVDLAVRRRKRQRRSKLIESAGWVGLATPLLWAGRGPAKKAAGGILKSAQERVSLAKQVLEGSQTPTSEQVPEQGEARKEAA